MRLHEEYFQRHGINQPVVNHCSKGSVILRRNSGVKPFLFVDINWIKGDRYPGVYNIEFNEPIHDGWDKGRFFNHVGQPYVKQWDEYEDFLLNWSRDADKSYTPIEANEAILASWEMMVYCYDGWFHGQNYGLKDLLFRTLDDELDIKKRLSYHEDMLNHLSVNFPGILNTWTSKFYVSNYSEWLVNLCKNPCLGK